MNINFNVNFFKILTVVTPPVAPTAQNLCAKSRPKKVLQINKDTMISAVESAYINTIVIGIKIETYGRHFSVEIIVTLSDLRIAALDASKIAFNFYV